MKKTYTKILSVVLLTALPVVSQAQGVDFTYLEEALGQVTNLVAQLIPLAIALGLLFFIWGLVQFIAASGSEEAKEEGKRRMVWGIIALFVIVAVWGLVGLLADLSGVELGAVISIPDTSFLN